MRFLLLILLFQTARGQLLPGLDPTLPEPESVGSIPSVEVQGSPSGEGAVLIESLTQVTLVSWADSGLQRISDHLEISKGLLLPDAPQLSKKFTEWMGGAIREGDLAAMADAILIHYDKAGYPVVMVDVPDQDLAEGNLTFVVEMGVIGNVGVTRPRYSDPESLRKGLWLKSGDVIQRGELNAQMDWYGRNIFRKPRLLVSPGLAPPSADILIGLTERKPWSVSLGYGNSGQKAIGRDQFTLGAAGMTQNEHVIAWQTVLGAPVSSLQANAVTWEIPFHGLHQTLQLSASIAEVETNTVVTGLPVVNQGTSWGISAFHKVPLLSMGNWKHSMRSGIELKSTDQFVLFGGTSLSPGEVRFLNFRVGYALERKWDDAGLSVNVDLIGSPGGWVSKNDDADFKNYDPEADSSYVIGRMSSEGWWTPGGDWRFGFRAEGQVADSRLLPAEQFAAGGYRSVRGVNERDFAADIGWQSSFEVYSPAITVAGNSGIRFLVFYDQAWVRNRGGSSDSLSGAGLGMRAKISDSTDLRLDQGWRLDDEGAMTHVGIRTSF
ncbi:MAG: ShlB/FhaC/HecB family hemolysin secretion/activation protein [Luteolibacter sp.]